MYRYFKIKLFLFFVPTLSFHCITNSYFKYSISGNFSNENVFLTFSSRSISTGAEVAKYFGKMLIMRLIV